MNQSSSNEKQTNIYYGTRLQVEVVPQPEGAEDQIYRIYTADMQLCPTLQDGHELRKDIYGVIAH